MARHKKPRRSATVRAKPHRVALDVAAFAAQAVSLHQQGRLQEAEALYRRILAHDPRHFDALHLSGVLLAQQGRHAEGCALIEQALVIRPGSAVALANRANALEQLGRYDEALACYERALAIKPDYAQAHNNRGNTLHALKRHEEALAAYDRAIALDPRFADALYNRSNELRMLKRYEEALAGYSQMLAVQPGFVHAYYNRGNTLQDMGRYADALAAYDRTLALKPDYADAHYNRGITLQCLKRYADAAAAFASLLKIAPAHPFARGHELHCRLQCCDWRDIAQPRDALIADVRAGRLADTPFAFISVADEPADQLACARRFADHKFPARSPAVWRGERYAHERIRVAYLSDDFKDHAVSLLLAGVFERHDRTRFEVTAISFNAGDDSVTGRRVRHAFDRFVDVSRKSDREVAHLMRGLEIDIAVDLMGYTGNARTDILAHRPAPVQVNFLGFPGTLGAPYIDYLIADERVVPAPQRAAYSEKIVCLPDAFQPNDDRRACADGTPTRAQAGLPDGGFVFCSFNNVYKFNPRVFDIWMRLLSRVPAGVLWLPEANAAAKANLLREAAARGIGAERLVFARRVPSPADHLARLRLADLFLDTLPYNAHTTASDALWAGLPLLTCVGRSFAARVAGSLLHAAGLPELATETLEAYEALALKLATDPHLLAGLRERLARNRTTCALFDTARYTKHLEAAYVTMRERAQRGEPPAAFAVAPSATAAPADGVNDLLQRAVESHRQGRLEQAQRLYREILARDAAHFDAQHLLGVVAYQEGRYDEAQHLLAAALQCEPASAAAHSNHANVLQALGRHEEALAGYDRALLLKPDYVEALFNRGIVLHHLERFTAALDSYDRALALKPDYAEALVHRGVALQALGRHEASLAVYDRALALKPGYVDALNRRGIVLLDLKRYEDALATYDRLLAVDAGFAIACNNRGNALRGLGRLDEALAGYDRALALRPDYADALNNRSRVLFEIRRHADAAEGYARLLKAAPAYPYARGQLLHARLYGCDWRDYAGDREAVIGDVRAGRHGDTPFEFLGVSGAARDQLLCARAYTAQKFPAVSPALWRDERYRHDRIRVAYVSADLRGHAVSALMAGVFEQHDRARFETTAISFGADDGSALGRRVRSAFERFVDVRGKGDLEVARLMRELEIDIAVDLAGFTARCRTGIFAHRPAPVQVNYLGFPGTMGAPYMDYVLADRHVIPSARTQDYAEQVVWLPDTFQANDDRRRIAERTPTREEAGLPQRGFVYCSFNANNKLTPEVFGVWMQVLRAVAGGVLWLVAGDALVEDNLRREAQARGVEPERLIFAPRLGYAEHLARYRLADLFLDTLPFNAGTTASDALWAGLPLLTCSGEAFAARMGASVLEAAGLPELVTQTLEQYGALAVQLATDGQLLAGLRARLAQNRMTCALFDTARFTRHLESAYVTMWGRAGRGEAPAAFAVEPLTSTRQ